MPSRASYPVLGTIITQLGDYYPLWQRASRYRLLFATALPRIVVLGHRDFLQQLTAPSRLPVVRLHFSLVIRRLRDPAAAQALDPCPCVRPLSHARADPRSIAQTGLLILVALESRHGFFEAALGTSVIWVVAFFIALEGLSGGYAYVSTFCRIPEDEAPGTDPQVSEFRRA